MDEEAYVKLAEEAIAEAEGRSMNNSLESFYRGLQTMMQTLQARIDIASSEGVKL